MDNSFPSSSSRSPTRRRAKRAWSSRCLLSTAAAAVATAAASSATMASAQSVQPATSAAQAKSISPVMTPAYAGFGIEPNNLFAFTGTSNPNRLTNNLLNTLANYTGVPPHLRIGGNTGDHMVYRPNLQGYVIQTNPNPTGGGNQGLKTDQFFFGPGYFQAIDNLPTGTPITYHLNLAYQGSDSMDVITQQAQAAMTMLNNVNVVGLEVGNEPDLYTSNGYRASYDANTYGQEWQVRATQIYNQVLRPLNIPSNFFEAAATATTATKNGNQYRINQLISTGVGALNGALLAGWNQHDYFYYIGISSYPITLDFLLDLSNTYNQFSEWAKQVGQALQTGKPYFLREMGSIGPTGIQGISDTFANTLWTFHFFLYAATLGISSVQMHMTQDSFGAAWQPITVNGTAPRVRSSFAAWAAINQMIGTQCTTRVAPADVSGAPNGYGNNVASFGLYKGESLRGVVLLNTKLSASSQRANRNSINFSLKVPNMAGKTLYLALLDAPGSDAVDGTTWNGMSYEQSGTGQATQVDGTVRTAQVGSDGSVTIPVADSQAVVAHVDSPLGANNTVDQAACASLSVQAGGDATKTGNAPGAAPTFRFGAAGPAARAPSALATAAVGALVATMLMLAASSSQWA